VQTCKVGVAGRGQMRPVTGIRYRFSAFWLRSKCSICSYQLNLWYVSHVLTMRLDSFLPDVWVYRFTGTQTRVGPVLQYLRDRPTFPMGEGINNKNKNRTKVAKIHCTAQLNLRCCSYVCSLFAVYCCIAYVIAVTVRFAAEIFIQMPFVVR
jgi:hypothetical protein